MTTKKQVKKTQSKKSTKAKKFNKLNLSLYFILGFVCLALVGVGVGIKINSETGEITITPNYTMSEEQVPAFVEDDKGANRSAWLSKFPNKSSWPYRKLVDYGS